MNTLSSRVSFLAVLAKVHLMQYMYTAGELSISVMWKVVRKASDN